MKLIILLIAFSLCVYAYPTDEKDISVEDSSHAESESDSKITKRSGSFDVVSQIKTGLFSGISKASASSSSGSSGGSSAYKDNDLHHVHGNSIEFDPWTLKKSVLNTLFQAVKAITGGVTAIKGQLIKGSGYASSASGKVIAVGGEKVSDIGKSIIHSAALIPPSHGHASVHPFKLSHGSSGGGHVVVPVVHSEVATYEVPIGYIPSKPPHGYLPAATYGQPFSGHASYEDNTNIDYVSTKYGVPNDDFIDYGTAIKKPTDYETAKAAEALNEILKILPTKPQLLTNSLETFSHTDDDTKKYITQQYPIPLNLNSSPLDLYKTINTKDKTTSYDYIDYKYKNFHQPNSNSNHAIAAWLVDRNKHQPKPYFYKPPEVRKHLNAHQF
ncbi:hypothetical protein ACFFRR_009586 [Megaselia abdita]